MFTYSTVPVDVMADSVSHLCRGWVEGGLMVILNIFRAITVINTGVVVMTHLLMTNYKEK